jgi:hypothetical protein
MSIVDPPTWGHAAAEWLAAIGTVAVALIAIFQEWFKRRVFRPRLTLNARVGRPAAEKFIWEMSGGRPNVDVYFFRLEITNKGNAPARELQLYVASAERLKQDGTYQVVDRFSPMNLLWTHTDNPTLPMLLPGMPPRFCDLGHIADPGRSEKTGERLPGVAAGDGVLALDLEVKANSLSYLLEPGTYRLALKLAASNHPPTDYTLEIKFPGRWFDEQDRMFSDGFGLRLA